MTDRSPALIRTAIGGTVRLLVAIALIGWGLVWSADTLGWAMGWWFIALFTVECVAATIYLWAVNPEIFAARKGLGKGTRPWDYLMVAIIVVGFTAILQVAGFDFRLGWSSVPVWVAVVGHIVMALGFLLITWAEAVNRHFEPTVRIQSDRDHGVIDSGPYATVRHPGYVGGMLVVVGMALALGSLWALVPAIVVTLTLAIRTVLEEATLRSGLAGYTAYTQRVSFRWVPGVW